MLHPTYMALAADAHYKSALKEAEIWRKLRASRQAGKRAGTRRDGSSAARRGLIRLGTS